jgi:plasmid stabilization system protein ParE
MLIGVYGNNDGLENTPDSPEGVPAPPPKARIGELLASQRGRSSASPSSRSAGPSSRGRWTTNDPGKLHPGNARAQRILAEDMQNRAACFWATPAARLLDPGQLPVDDRPHPPGPGHGQPRRPRQRDGPRGHGRRLGQGHRGHLHRQGDRAGARASAGSSSWRRAPARPCGCSSTRSRPLFPNGLATRAAWSASTSWTRSAPTGAGRSRSSRPAPHNEDGAGRPSRLFPWWLYKEQLAGKLGFARGYHVEFGPERACPGGLRPVPPDDGGRTSFGRKLKEDARRYYGSFMGFSGRGEMIPNDDSFCELDPKVVDKWGIPVLRFHWKWSEHEIRQVAHMQRTFADWIEAMGGHEQAKARPRRLSKAIEPAARHPRGRRHDHGRRPGASVTNSWSQTWDVKNVFVADGGVFASNADKNPTLTIMALAWRTADRILDEMRGATSEEEHEQTPSPAHGQAPRDQMDAGGGRRGGASGRSMGGGPADGARRGRPRTGYGTDPDLMRPYKPGDYWPLTFSEAQRARGRGPLRRHHPRPTGCRAPRQVGVRTSSTSGSAPRTRTTSRTEDRPGRARVAGRASRAALRQPFAGRGAGAAPGPLRGDGARGGPRIALEAPVRFFRRSGTWWPAGFYTTPVGMKDLGYVGNVPLAPSTAPRRPGREARPGGRGQVVSLRPPSAGATPNSTACGWWRLTR